MKSGKLRLRDTWAKVVKTAAAQPEWSGRFRRDISNGDCGRVDS